MNGIIMKKAKKVRHTVPLRMRLRSGWPLLIWVLAGLICIPLLLRKSNWQMAERIHGMVGRETIVIAPEETARVQKILVTAGQSVKKGEALVEMDTASIDHELAETLLDARRMANSLSLQLGDLQDDVAQRKDRLNGVEKDLAECRMDWAAEQAELKTLREIQARRDALHTTSMIDNRELNEYLPRIAELEQKTAMREAQVKMFEAQAAEARAQMDIAVNALRDFEASEGGSDFVKNMLGRIEEDTARYRDSYTLRSPTDGVVSEVRSEEGEVVRADDTVLRVVPGSLSTVVALVPEQQSTHIKKGQRVWISALNMQEEKGRMNLPAIAESVSDEVRVEAAMLNMTGRAIPMRSRRAILRLEHPAESALIAGEVVEVRLTAPSADWTDTIKHRLLNSHD